MAKKKHSLESCMASASRFATKKDWNHHDRASASAAARYGWYEACTAHMHRVERVSADDYIQYLASDERGFTALDPYVQARVKIRHRCPKGHVWLVTPNQIRNGKGCPHCSGRIPELEYSEWLNRYGDGITTNQTYVNANTHLIHQCAEGHEWSAMPSNIKRGHGCPYCSGHIPGDYHEWLEKDGRGIVALEPYIAAAAKIKHRCKLGHEWSVSPNTIKSGIGCPECKSIKLADLHSHSHESYEEALRADGRGIVVLDRYKNGKTALRHRCPEGHEWPCVPQSIMYAGSGCPECAEYGFNPSKDGVLYIAEHKLKRGRIRVNVGITNNSFERRYTKADLSTVLRVHTIRGAGHFIADLERRVLDAFAKCIDPTGLGLQKKVGTKECLKAEFDEVVKVALDAAA